MFTDEKLKQLHLDAEYRKSNRLLTNLKHSVHIVKNGNGYFSLTMSTSSSVSLSINLIKIFWFILKYIFIFFLYCFYGYQILFPLEDS